MRECWLCGKNGAEDPLDLHHVFNGAYKKKSERYGLLVYLCHDACHETGRYAVHRNAETERYLKQWGQRKVMREQHWTTEEFIEVFGKNYLEEEICSIEL